MTKTIFTTRPVASIVAAMAASVLVAGSVAAQDTRVGLDRDFEVPSVSQIAVEAPVDTAPAISAYDAMIAGFSAAATPTVVTGYDNMVSDLQSRYVPAPTTAYDAMIADFAAASTSSVVTGYDAMISDLSAAAMPTVHTSYDAMVADFAAAAGER